MNLLFLIREEYPTFRVAVNTLFGKYLPRFGIRSSIVTAAGKSKLSQNSWGGGHLILTKCRSNRILNQINSFIHDVSSMLRSAKDYDAIQVRDKIIIAVVGLILARLAGIPFFYWMSFPYPEDDLMRVRVQRKNMGFERLAFTLIRGLVSKWIFYNLIVRLADQIFVLSEKMQDEIIKRGAHIEKTTVVPVGVDSEAIDHLAPTVNNMESRLIEKRILVYAGELAITRKLDILFEMLSLVREKEPKVVLLLIGDANEEADRSWLEERARQIGVADAVIWTGWLPQEKAWALSRYAEIGLSPIPLTWIYQISSPTKPQEYLMLGLPVVASPIPDQVKIINESGGGIITEFAPEKFAEAVLRLLANPELSSKMAKQGKEYIRRLRSYNSISRALAERYRELVIYGKKKT